MSSAIVSSIGPAVGASRADNLRRCVADINRQGVDAVIHAGDSVQHGVAEEYAHLHEIVAGLEAPLFLTPGNRDGKAALRAAFDAFSYLPRDGDLLHYAVEDYPVRLVALDSVAEGERKGVFGAERLAWLEETLARKPDTPTILFIHHPPFDIPPDYVGGYRRQQDAVYLAAAVSRHTQVVQLLCGHVHWFHREPWAAPSPPLCRALRWICASGSIRRSERRPYIFCTPSRATAVWSPERGSCPAESLPLRGGRISTWAQRALAEPGGGHVLPLAGRKEKAFQHHLLFLEVAVRMVGA